ncbi:shikimate dehydrogenase [Serpentinimonas barnesii]|uniref:shikimate dehydrogenase n=1 Tax=Serpentinimonas barnesii TaxID=1458427 RepID=UPI0004954F9E|nr:shikimate dehydrogenase [Serpentinimonas barnesii]
MDRYAVIGHPIGHSKSPVIHSAFAAATGQRLSYEAIEAPLEAGQFAATVERFRSEGGRGVNVTLPFKPEACAYATHLAESARCAGAANALKFEGDRCLAENFDGSGLVRDLSHNLGQRLAGRTVLLLGAGGASRGAILPLLRTQAGLLLVVNRNAAKAQALVAEFIAQGASANTLAACGYDEIGSQRFDLVLNATSASLSAEGLPLPARAFKPDGLAYDMVYGKGLTPFLRQAQQAGVHQLADGVGMLVEQAAEAFAWWRGVRPDTAEVIHRLSLPLI